MTLGSWDWLYHGNGTDGWALRPRQRETDWPDDSVIAPLGLSDSFTEVGLCLTLYMPMGTSDVRLHWQVAPLGVPFTDPSAIEGTEPFWARSSVGGFNVVRVLRVDGLTPGTPYHWRVRLLYHPGNRLGQPASRWVHMPWNGWNETDFRMRRYDTVYLPLVRRDS